MKHVTLDRAYEFIEHAKAHGHDTAEIEEQLEAAIKEAKGLRILFGTWDSVSINGVEQIVLKAESLYCTHCSPKIDKSKLN